jgi:hypothetical protein
MFKIFTKICSGNVCCFGNYCLALCYTNTSRILADHFHNTIIRSSTSSGSNPMEDQMSAVTVEQFIEISTLLSLAHTFQTSAQAPNLSQAQRAEMQHRAAILRRAADRASR